MHKRYIFIVLILILIVTSSCTSASQEPTSAPAPSIELIPTNIEPPVPTATTAAPLPVATSTTDLSLRDNLRILYAGPKGIWASRLDGTSLVKLTDFGLDGIDLRRVLSPYGDRLIFNVQTEEGLDLVEVLIPSGETRTIAHLYSITKEELTANPASPRAFTAYAIRDYDNVALQPGGRFLAFVGAMDGPTSDLYLYDMESGEIKRLTDGDVQAVFPTWSWDGEFILLYGVSWKGPFDGAVSGHDHLDEVVSVRASTGKGFMLPVPKSVAFNFVGWQDERHYITYDTDETCGSHNLRSVDVLTGEITPLMDTSFSSGFAYSYGPFLFTSEANVAGCPNSPGAGTFLLPYPYEGTSPIELLDKPAADVSRVTESMGFYIYPEGFFSETGEGIKLYEPPVYEKSFHPAISYKGNEAWEVIENGQGRVVVKGPGGDWQTVLEGDVAAMTWNLISSETLIIVLKDGSLYTAPAPDFIPHLMGTMEGVNQIWAPLP